MDQSTNERGCHFPVQNLPYNIFSVSNSPFRCVAAIGDQMIDTVKYQVFGSESLDAFMAFGPEAWSRFAPGSRPR
ncbi:hypothetical protein [Methylocapsa sp. S129]|uniref:hypothetical protein n=1 Tax=Methylocapsa sp. S129 TaxID=1641869 RepID=UPI00131A918E